jgi:hypothetical protein
VIHTIAVPAYLEVWQALLLVVMLAWYVIAIVAAFGSLSFLFGHMSFSQIGAFGIVVLAVGVVSAVFVVFAFILAVALRTSVYPVLKVFADIVLWLADGDYRNRLRVALGAEIRSIRMSAGDTLILATHSLGTVIAIDYLLSLNRDLTNCERFILITAGSPLRFLMHGFFPEWFSDPCLISQYL